MIFYLLYLLCWLPVHLIFPTRVIGKKNLIKNQRMILSANHQTLNDAILVAIYLPMRFKYMAKAPLFKNKLFGWFLRKVGAYPVHAGQSDLTSVKKTLQFLKEDRAVCIFPEGTRLTSDEKNQLHNGVAMFSLKTKSPIVPAMFMKKTLAFSTNTLVIGQPIKFYEMIEFQDKKIEKETLDKASEILRDAIYGIKRDYIANKKNKIFQIYQDKIIKLEIRKAKLYTYHKEKRVSSLSKKIDSLQQKMELRQQKIK